MAFRHRQLYIGSARSMGEQLPAVVIGSETRPGKRMRVLFISNSFPSDLKSGVAGVFNRLRLFLDAIKSMSEIIDVLLFAPSQVLARQSARDMAGRIEQLWGPKLEVTVAPRQERVKDWSGLSGNFNAYLSGLIDFTRLPYIFHSYYDTTGATQIEAVGQALDRQPDWIFAHRLTAMAPLLRLARPLPPVVFDLDDIEHRAFASRLRLSRHSRTQKLCYLQIPSIMRGEHQAIKLARATFICSPQDRDYLNRLYHVRSTAVIPNSVEMPERHGEDIQTPVLGFIGAYQWQPNADAANFFIDAIWPLIRRAIPNAQLLLAGTNIELIAASRQNCDGITYLGFVEKLETFYERVAVIICPIRGGGGTRIKIIEAASYGKPIVSTTIGASGLEFRDGESISLRDDPESFATACVALLKDSEQRRALGLAARRRAELNYGRAEVMSLARDAMLDMLGDIYRNGSPKVSTGEHNERGKATYN